VYSSTCAKEEATAEQYSEFGEEEESPGKGGAETNILSQHGSVSHDLKDGGGSNANVLGTAESEQEQGTASRRDDDAVKQEETRRQLETESENGVEKQRGSEATTVEIKDRADEKGERFANVDSAEGAESTEPEVHGPGYLTQDTASSRDAKEKRGEEASTSIHCELKEGDGVKSSDGGEPRGEAEASVESGYRSASFEGDVDTSVR